MGHRANKPNRVGAHISLESLYKTGKFVPIANSVGVNLEKFLDKTVVNRIFGGFPRRSAVEIVGEAFRETRSDC
jgi:hypothetical protein